MAAKRRISQQIGEDEMEMGTEKAALNILVLIVTAIMGAVAWFVGSLVYTALSPTLPMPLLVGIIFAILALLTVFAVLLTSKLMGSYETNLVTGRVSDGIVLYLIIGIAVIFAAAALFQWIYGLDFKTVVKEPSSYIFMIDDSGSMEGNDPDNQRFAAIESLLMDKDQDFQYAVYTFADEVTLAKSMAPISEGATSIPSHSFGGTNIGAALEKVIDDINTGVVDGGANPKVILLSDGIASDIGLFNNMRSYTDGYSDKGIVISTIGLGNANSSQLKRIAENTGGVFVGIEDATQIDSAFSEAATGNNARDMLSARAQQPNDWIYGVLRVIFLSLLATAIGLCAAYAYGLKESFNFTLVSSVIKAVLAALIVELGTTALDLDYLPVLIASVLTASTLATIFLRKQGRRSIEDNLTANKFE